MGKTSPPGQTTIPRINENLGIIGVEHHPSHRPTTDRDRHTQRRPGQFGVVPLAQGEPDAPPGMQIQDRGQVENTLPSGDLGQITTPRDVRPGGCRNPDPPRPAPSGPTCPASSSTGGCA